MDETQLSKVEDGLSLMIKKFKTNNTPKDARRLMATLDAKKAIRRVILIVALHGDIKNIIPIFDEKLGVGWEITDFGEGVKKVFSN